MHAALPSAVERTFASLLIGFFSLLGLVTCLYAIIVVTIKKQKITAFNIICLFRCSINVIALSCYFFYQLPQAVLGIRDPLNRRNAVFMCIIANVYIVLEYLCCIMAANRFLAIYSWNLYQLVFKRPILLLIIFAIIIHRLSVIIPFIQIFISGVDVDCYMIFDGRFLVWVADGACRLIENTAIFTFIFITIVAVVNLLTFFRLLYIYVADFVAFLINFQVKTSQSNIKIKQNGILFAQTICQDLLFVVDMLFMTQMMTLSSNPFWQFVCNDFTGLLVHSLDSVLLIIFQPELRKICKKESKTKVLVLQNTSQTP